MLEELKNNEIDYVIGSYDPEGVDTGVSLQFLQGTDVFMTGDVGFSVDHLKEFIRSSLNHMQAKTKTLPIDLSSNFICLDVAMGEKFAISSTMKLTAEQGFGLMFAQRSLIEMGRNDVNATFRATKCGAGYLEIQGQPDFDRHAERLVRTLLNHLCPYWQMDDKGQGELSFNFEDNFVRIKWGDDGDVQSHFFYVDNSFFEEQSKELLGS